MSTLKPIIGHFHPIWLPSTMTWLYRQVVELGMHCDNFVYAEKKDHEQRFPIENLRLFSELPVFERMSDRFKKKFGFTDSLNSLTQMMRMDHIQLLHSHFGHIGVTGAAMAKSVGIPHVVSFYGLDIHHIPKKYPSLGANYEKMFRSTERVFCEGAYMAQSIVGLGADPDKVKVHPLGIDLDSISFEPRVWDQKGPINFLIAASFRQKKGIPLALKALAEIKKHHEIRITIIGDSGLDQESLLEKKNIYDTVHQHNLESVVTFLGFKSHMEMFEIAREHHIFVQPSLHAENGDCEGGIPVALIELAASGMMVVGSDHCDIPSVVVDGETGWLSMENSLVDLVHKISECINNYDSWSDIAKNARKLIELDYCAKSQSQKLFNHYLEVINAG